MVYVPSHLYHMVFELFKVRLASCKSHEGSFHSAVLQIENFLLFFLIAERHACHHGAIW